jgi:hypothetical protein
VNAASRLDDALALSRHAADLAGLAAALARPGEAEATLAVAEAVTHTAAAVQALATTVIDAHLAQRHTHRPGDTQ